MAALSIGTKSIWYHGTHRAAAAAIMAGGFRLDVGTSHGRWYGAGVYVSERAEDAVSWARGFADQGVVVVCRLAAGVRLDDVSRVDSDHIAALCYRYGPGILNKRPWAAVPANKHLSRRDWAALYAYHVHHPDDHIGCNLPREPWFHTISRIRSAIARCGGGGLYRTHGDDPQHPSASEAIIFDPSQVIPVRVHELSDDAADRYALGPVVEVASLDAAPPVRSPLATAAWDAVGVLQERMAWDPSAVHTAMAAVAAYGHELGRVSPTPPGKRHGIFDPWHAILQDFAEALLNCGQRLSNQRLIARLHAALMPHPASFRHGVWKAIAAAADDHRHGPGKKTGGRRWSEFIALAHHRMLSPTEPAP